MPPREKFQDANALAELSRSLRAAAAAGQPATTSGRERVGPAPAQPVPRPPPKLAANPAPPPVEQAEARKPKRRASPAPQPVAHTPPPDWPSDIASFIDSQLLPAGDDAQALSAALAALDARLAATACPPAIVDALARAQALLARATPPAIPHVAAQAAADLVAAAAAVTAAPDVQAPSPPASSLAAHAAAFEDSIEKLRVAGGADPVLLRAALTSIVEGV